MRKLIVATAFVALVSATAAAQAPPSQSSPAPPQAAPNGMMDKGMMHSDSGCPMMKKMASLEDRVKKLEENTKQH
jgi:opacity protein-like surface antigen